MARTIHIRIPKDEGQRLLWAASIAQTAATLLVADPDASEHLAIDNALDLYADVLERIDQGRELDDDNE